MYSGLFFIGFLVLTCNVHLFIFGKQAALCRRKGSLLSRKAFAWFITKRIRTLLTSGFRKNKVLVRCCVKN